MFVVLKIIDNHPENISLFFSENLAYKKYVKLLENSINNDEIEGIDSIADIEGYSEDIENYEAFIDFVYENINSDRISFHVQKVKVK